MQEDSFIKEYTPLVVSIAHKAKNHPSIELEDMIQFGYMGLLQARKSYKPESETDFSTYAYRRIWGAMMDGRRAMDWMSRYYRNKYGSTTIEMLDKDILDPNPSSIDLKEDSMDISLVRDKLEEALKILNGTQKDCIYLYYFKGLTMKDTGDLLEITEARVSQVIGEGLQKLHHYLHKTSLITV